MPQVMTTALPNGRPLHVPYDAIGRAALNLYHAGREMGEVPKGSRGAAGLKATEAYEKARKRGDEARKMLEDEIEAAMGIAVEHAWDQAMASLRPFQCGHCGERFETAIELINHATMTPGNAECRAALEMGLRLASDWARPKAATANGS
jgi:hypothetical protein